MNTISAQEASISSLISETTPPAEVISSQKEAIATPETFSIAPTESAPNKDFVPLAEAVNSTAPVSSIVNLETGNVTQHGVPEGADPLTRIADTKENDFIQGVVQSHDSH